MGKAVRLPSGSLLTTDNGQLMTEKIALYFESGAQEVWICDQGILKFHFSVSPEVRPISEMCPGFPPQTSASSQLLVVGQEPQ